MPQPKATTDKRKVSTIGSASQRIVSYHISYHSTVHFCSLTMARGSKSSQSGKRTRENKADRLARIQAQKEAQEVSVCHSQDGTDDTRSEPSAVVNLQRSTNLQESRCRFLTRVILSSRPCNRSLTRSLTHSLTHSLNLLPPPHHHHDHLHVDRRAKSPFRTLEASWSF